MTETTTDTRAMTPEQLAEIEIRANAAPKGPWVIEGDYPQRVTNAEALIVAECFEGPQWPPSIAEFITHAREDVPALLAEVKRQAKRAKSAEGGVLALEQLIGEIERLAYVGGQDAETVRRAILGVFEKRSRS